jgi:hypothetical protein
MCPCHAFDVIEVHRGCFRHCQPKGEPLARQQRALESAKVIDLYEPFILDSEYFFAADHIKSLAQALPDEEVDRSLRRRTD